MLHIAAGLIRGEARAENMRGVAHAGVDSVFGVLALELGEGPAPATRMLPTEAAAALAGFVAGDLVRLLPGVEALGLGLAAALFDQAQLLRPGWPAFSRLAMLYDEHVRGRDPAAVVAFGTSGDAMVDAALVPESTLDADSLLLLPFTLRGEAGAVHELGERMESDLGESGLAAAATALFLSHALSVKVEHARYMTRDDLCALCALQLEHAGLGPAWLLIEGALFPPGATREQTALTGQRMRRTATGVELELLDLAAWLRGPAALVDPDGRTDAFLAWQREQRRLAALFEAHGLQIEFRHGALRAATSTGYWIEPQAAPADSVVAQALYAHTAPDLGIVAVTAAAREPGGWRHLSRGYPLGPDGIGALRRALAERHGHDGTLRQVPLVVSPEADEFVLPK